MKFLLFPFCCALLDPVSVAMVWLRPRGNAKICRDLYLSLKVKLYFIPLHQRQAPLKKKKHWVSSLSISFLSCTHLNGSLDLLWVLIILFNAVCLDSCFRSCVVVCPLI